MLERGGEAQLDEKDGVASTSYLSEVVKCNLIRKDGFYPPVLHANAPPSPGLAFTFVEGVASTHGQALRTGTPYCSIYYSANQNFQNLS